MKNKKGFVFIETIIVIATVLASLLILYAAYANMVRVERRRVRYDDPAFIYKTYAVGKFLLSMYDDEGLSIVSKKIEENRARLADPSHDPNEFSEGDYISILSKDIDFFSEGYANGNQTRQPFFASMYNDLNIQNIYIISDNTIKTIANDRDSYKSIPYNFYNYILSLDMSDHNPTNPSQYKYYLIVEYAEKVNGQACEPNQLMQQQKVDDDDDDANKRRMKSETSCTFFYANMEIMGGA